MNTEKIKDAVTEIISSNSVIDDIVEAVVCVINDNPLEDFIDKESLEQWATDNGYTKPEET